MIDLTYDRDVAVVTMRAGENRLNRGFVDRFNEVLDEVEAGPPAAMVTTGEGKYYSNGLDLEWLSREDRYAGWLTRSAGCGGPQAEPRGP